MAKAEGTFQDAQALSPGRKTRILQLQTQGGITYKEKDGYIILCKKNPRVPALKGKFQYQKELFCYADLMYKSMTRTQRTKWIQYYNDKKREIQIIRDRRKKKKKTRFKKKYWGYHNFALWVWSIFNDQLGEFFYDYLGARFLIDELEVVGGKIKVKGWIVHKDFIKLIEEIHGEDVRRLPRG